MRFRQALLMCTAVAIALIFILWWRLGSPGNFAGRKSLLEFPVIPPVKPLRNTRGLALSTSIHAHNLLLRKGPDFRVYVRWLDGHLARTRKTGNPSFSDPDFFALDIHSGILRANIGDIGHFLNASLTDSPLTNVVLSADGDKLRLTGTVHKIVSVPIQVLAAVSANSDNRIRVHIMKLDVMKVPLKGLLGIFRISLSDLVKKDIDGVEISGSDILIDTQKMLPPPHIQGKLAAVRVVSPDLEEVFGDATEDVERVEMWRNFLSLNGGVMDFGNLTMNQVDLMMIDISENPWFDLDLINYQAQLAAGYTRMTSQSGLQIFMPDLRDVKPTSGSGDTSVEWFKNRNIPPPSQIVKSLR